VTGLVVQEVDLDGLAPADYSADPMPFHAAIAWQRCKVIAASHEAPWFSPSSMRISYTALEVLLSLLYMAKVEHLKQI
jgi:hypothetical protein